MDIEEIRKAKMQLADRIHSEIAVLVKDFEKKTGMCPETIIIHMTEVTTHQDSSPKYIPEPIQLQMGWQ